MSYDLAVFDPRSELRERGAFESWYAARTEWSETLDYSRPSNASPILQQWYQAMIATFPSLNAEARSGDPDKDKWGADYCICTDLIYVGAPSSKATVAYEVAHHLAMKYGLGFCDISGDGGVWFPAADGILRLVHVAD